MVIIYGQQVGRTVPQIVIGSENIGGYDDLMKLNSEKKLNI